MSAFAPASSPMAWSSPSTRSRPPASRIQAPGITSRKSAIACSASLGELPPGRRRGAPHGDDDAELGRARVACRPRCRDDVVEVEEGEHVDTGLEPGGLRAERAVLGARARLGVDEALELDLGPAVGE